MSTIPGSVPSVKGNKPRKPRPPRPSAAQVTDVDCEPAVKGTGAEWFLRIWQGPRFSCYWLLPLVSDFGIAYQFQASRTRPATEMQADAYDVCVEIEGDNLLLPRAPAPRALQARCRPPRPDRARHAGPAHAGPRRH